MTTTSTGQYTDRRPPYRQLISQVPRCRLLASRSGERPSPIS